MNATKLKFAIPLFFALAYVPTQGWAGPLLGTADAFVVLAGSTVTNTGATTLDGNLGLFPGTSYTGSGTVTQTGTAEINNGVAKQAQIDNTTAYNALKGLSPTTVLTGTDLGGKTLKKGVYFFASSAQLTGALTLDAEGVDDAYWVFQIGSTLTTASDSSVVLINPGANNGTDSGLYWQVGSSATLGTTTDFEGNILALTDITLNTGATIHNGRALAQNGAVTMDTNTLSIHSPGGTGTFSGGIEFNDQGQVVEVGGGPLAQAPEPATLLLFGVGLAGLFTSRKRLLPVA